MCKEIAEGRYAIEVSTIDLAMHLYQAESEKGEAVRIISHIASNMSAVGCYATVWISPNRIKQLIG